MRNVHRWSAHLMVLVVAAHMARVFYRGAYKAPREFNWVIGVVLLVLTLLLSFTGYLLPWDQLAYWAVTVGAEMAGFVPFLGETIKGILIGGRYRRVGHAAAVLRAACGRAAGGGGRPADDPPVALAQGRHARHQGRRR